MNNVKKIEGAFGVFRVVISVVIGYLLSLLIIFLMARRKILCKRFSTKSRMALENRADSGLDPLITESHGGQNGMCAGTA